MTVPLIVLAILSTVGGFFDVTKWLAPMYRHPEGENISLVILSIAAGVIGILLAAYMYWLKPAVAASMKEGPLYRLIYNKYYVDEIYNAFIVKPIEIFSRFVLWKGVDDALIDGTVNGGSRRIRGLGAALRHMQSGTIRNYATWVMTGSLLVLILLGLAGGGK
jgi:NADH-quinone oxidoreductase subunit L